LTRDITGIGYRNAAEIAATHNIANKFQAVANR